LSEGGGYWKKTQQATPLAYHITFGTYGARLHGDEKGTVDRRTNVPGTPVVGEIDARRRIEMDRMRFPPVFLTAEQRRHAEAVIPEICTRGGWTHHVSAAGPDHVHVVLTTDRDGQKVRHWLKRWLGESLSARWRLIVGQSWWAEGGSVKRIWENRYFREAVEYVRNQRATPSG